MLQLILSRMVALRTTLEDRGGVSLQSSGLVCLLSRVKKIKASPRQRLQVYSVQPTIKAWGFPKPGSSPVACPTGGRSHLACSATLWNWDLGNKHRTMMILQLLLLLRRVCVCVHTCVCVCACARTRMSTRALLLSHVQIFTAPWNVAHQAPLSVGSSRQEYWSGLPFPTPGNLPNQGIEPSSLVLPSLAGGFFATEPSGNLLCL